MTNKDIYNGDETNESKVGANIQIKLIQKATQRPINTSILNRRRKHKKRKETVGLTDFSFLNNKCDILYSS